MQQSFYCNLALFSNAKPFFPNTFIVAHNNTKLARNLDIIK